MSHSDMIYQADKAITANPKALRCQNDADHGKMFPHGSGAGLICGKCGFQAPMSAAEPDEQAD